MAYESRLEFSNEELKVWLAGYYGLEVEIAKVRAGYMSTVVWLNAQNSQLILKIYGEDELNQIRYGLSVATHLGDSGLPVAACFPTLAGDPLAELHGRVAVLWSCLSGDVFEIGNLKQLEQAGRMLGRYHRTQALMSNKVEGAYAEGIKKELQETWAKVKDSDGLKIVQAFDECLEEIWGGIPLDLPETILHRDYRAQNLLFEHDELSGILDLDGSCVGPRIFDLVYALAFFQAVIAKAPLSQNEMVSFIQAYDVEVGLTDGELEGLSAWFSLALLKGMTLWLRIGYVDGVSDLAKEWIEAYMPFFAARQVIADDLIQALRRKG